MPRSTPRGGGKDLFLCNPISLYSNIRGRHIYHYKSDYLQGGSAFLSPLNPPTIQIFHLVVVHIDNIIAAAIPLLMQGRIQHFEKGSD